MSGKAPKRKGDGYEREVVRAHIALGVDAFKTPLSGALGGRYAGDIQLAGMKAECKRRRKNFSSLYAALDQQGADLLFVRDDQKPTLVVLPWTTWALVIDWLQWAKKFPATGSEVGGTDRQKQEDRDDF